MTDFATQSGHWYGPDGTPRYTIIGKNGKERPTDVRDARKHGFLPSVTMIIRQAAAPGLELWKCGNILDSALTLARQEGESDADFRKRILYDADERARKARERGTAIHGALERAYKTGEIVGYPEHIAQTMAEVHRHTGLNARDWSAERSFGNVEYGFGGKLDLSCDKWVIDFKTTDKPLEECKIWTEHEMQLSAYRTGLCMGHACRGAIVYVHVDGKAKFMEVEEEDLLRGWNMFYSLLRYWKSKAGVE